MPRKLKPSEKMASSSSSSLTPAMEDGGYRNWAELPPELTSSILYRLGAFEMLENAQKVCRSWRDVCKDPLMWRKIDMRYLRDVKKYYDLGKILRPRENITTSGKYYDLGKMCRHAVDRSQGGLVQIEIWYFGTDELINYIADSSRNLRSLKLAMCCDITDDGFAEAVGKLPLLEDLEVSYCYLSAESMEVVGKSCPNLKTLKLNTWASRWYPHVECDDEALAIAETMPGLRHLQLFGGKLSNTGLNTILDNCHNLEHLDLRHCFHVDLDGDMEKQCSKRIKCFRRPNDSTHDYPYEAIGFGMESSEDSSDHSAYDYY